jgi:ribose transport system substrate-binding protein
MKKIYFLMLALGVAGLFQGCEKSDNNLAQKKLRIAFVPNSANDFWTIARNNCVHSAQLLSNVDLNFYALTNSTMEAQEEIISNLVVDGVDGIAVCPIDAEKQTPFLDWVASKTLLVCIDSDAESSKRACFIGTDNVAAGKKAANFLRAALPQGGKIILFVGFANAQNAKDRIQSIQSELAGSNIQIIDILEDGIKPDVALKNAQTALANHPDLAGMVGIYSYNGPAILTAVRGANRAGQVKIVCFDDESETLSGIAAGDIYGTVVQSPGEFGHVTLVAMDNYLCGDKTMLVGGKILFPSLMVSKANLADYQSWRNDMLHK